MGSGNSHSVDLACQQLQNLTKALEQKNIDIMERSKKERELYKQRAGNIRNYYKSLSLRMEMESNERILEKQLDILRQLKSLEPYENKINANIGKLNPVNNEGHRHKFSDIDGKCDFCNILGCKNGLINHRFNHIDGKCDFCDILGCKYNLSNHKFNDIDGKCDYCNILGCVNGFIKHKYDDFDGKCDYCGKIHYY